MKKIYMFILGILVVGAGLGYHSFSRKADVRGQLDLKAFTSKQSLEQAVVSVNQSPISLGMLLEEIKKKGGHIPGRFAADEQRQRVIDELVHFELLAQQAKKLNYHNDPEIRLAYKKMLVAKFKREQIQTKLSEIVITDEMVKDYYEDHIDSYREPTMHRIAMIKLRKPLIKDKQKARALKNKAKQIRQMAKQEDIAGFGKLAAKYSDDLQTKYKGGALPWLSKSARYFRLEPDIVYAAFNLKEKGETSDIIETKNGLYILKLIDRKQQKTKPLEAVRLQIQSDLKAGLKQKWLDDFHQQLKTNAEIVTNDNILDEDVIWKSQAIVHSKVPTFPAR